MSRSGYSECLEQWDLIRWRGAVASGLRGKRGQAFLRELIAALDQMPEKQLIAGDLVDADGSVCALGCVGAARGLDMATMDATEHRLMSQAFGIPRSMVMEIEWENDEGVCGAHENSKRRWEHVRAWAENQLMVVC